jgi:hypothetical protein
MLLVRKKIRIPSHQTPPPRKVDAPLPLSPCSSSARATFLIPLPSDLHQNLQISSDSDDSISFDEEEEQRKVMHTQSWFATIVPIFNLFLGSPCSSRFWNEFFT